MIEFFTGSTNQIAFYDNADKIISIPLTFITVLSTVMMPRIANEYLKGNTDKVEKYLINAGKISLFLSCPMMIGISCIASKFIPWYLGNEYNSAILGIILLSPIIICNSMEGISGKQYFIATNRIKELSISYISTAIINIIINIILIHKIGFIGAIIATLFSSYVCMIIQFYYLNKEIRVIKLIPCALRYLTYSLIMGIIITIMSKNLNNTPITTLSQIVIGLAVYIGLCIITRDEIIDMIKNKININKTSIESMG